jgi:hypothetical protein
MASIAIGLIIASQFTPTSTLGMVFLEALPESPIIHNVIRLFWEIRPILFKLGLTVIFKMISSRFRKGNDLVLWIRLSISDFS